MNSGAMLEVRLPRAIVGCVLGAAMIAAALLCLGGHPAASEPARTNQDPEHTIRPLRALLAISEEPVQSHSSCDQGLLLPNKPGPQQIGDLIAISLAYHGVGDSKLRGSCDRDGNADCIVSLTHTRKRKGYPDELQFTIFKFKIVDGKAQPASLECEISP